MSDMASVDVIVVFELVYILAFGSVVFRFPSAIIFAKHIKSDIRSRLIKNHDLHRAWLMAVKLN